MEILIDYVIIFFRIITIMLLLLFCTLVIMGKRPIGELPIFDFLSLIVLGAIVGADIADPKIEHLPTAFAVVILALYQRLISHLIIKNKKINKWLTFEPTIIIQRGQFIHKNLKKIKYSVDEVLMLLREQEVFDLSQLEYAIIESSGKLSLMKKAEYESVQKRDLKLNNQQATLPVVVILEGKVNKENLRRISLKEEDLHTKMKLQGYFNVSEIFFASMTQDGLLSISPYNIDADVIKT